MIANKIREIQAAQAELAAELKKLQEGMLEEIMVKIEECAQIRGLTADKVVAELAHSLGLTVAVPPVPKTPKAATTGGARKGKPNVKAPMMAKLDAAGIKYKSQNTIPELQKLLDDNKL